MDGGQIDIPGRLRIPKAFRDLMKSIRFKGWFGGRGGAKSRSFASAAILQAIDAPPPGIRFLCCREIQRSIDESVKYTLDQTITIAKLNDYFVSSRDEIRAANGSLFLFEGLGANVNKIQSLADIDRVWVDEAQALSNRSLETLIPTIRKEGSELWFSWNPREATDPVDVMFRGPDAQHHEGDRVPKPYHKWMVTHQVGWRQNQFFPGVLREQMERDKRRDPDKYAHIWLGGYLQRSELRVFRNWRIGTTDITPDMKRYYGADWGFSIDPTVLVRCWVDPKRRLMYVDAVVSSTGISIHDTPAFFDRLDNAEARKWLVIADSAWPQNIDYLKKHGYSRIEPAVKGPNSVEEGVEFMKSYDILVHPNCRPVIDELSTYSYKVDKHTDNIIPELADRDNNTIDALRYAVEKERRIGYDRTLKWVK